MKKFAKLISMTLAVVMLVLAVPFTAGAKTLTETTFDESKLLLVGLMDGNGGKSIC